jgi:hypothetical protein
MRTTSLFLVVVLVTTLGLSGCATMEENRKTTVGAGAGAVGGALLGGLIGRNTTGVVVGGLLGALAGGAIGQYMDRQDKSAAQAKAETNYTPAQGIVVRVDSVQVDPTSVTPGGTANLGATYTVLTPTANQNISVRETREVRHNGVMVANPTTQFTRQSGTYTSALPVTLPAGAARGTYEVLTTVLVGDRSSRGMSTFTVR